MLLRSSKVSKNHRSVLFHNVEIKVDHGRMRFHHHLGIQGHPPQSRTSTKSTNLLLRKFDLQQAPELQEMHSLAQQTLIFHCGCLQWIFVRVLMLWRKNV